MGRIRKEATWSGPPRQRKKGVKYEIIIWVKDPGLEREREEYFSRSSLRNIAKVVGNRERIIEEKRLKRMETENIIQNLDLPNLLRSIKEGELV